MTIRFVAHLSQCCMHLHVACISISPSLRRWFPQIQMLGPALQFRLANKVWDRLGWQRLIYFNADNVVTCTQCNRSNYALSFIIFSRNTMTFANLCCSYLSNTEEQLAHELSHSQTVELDITIPDGFTAWGRAKPGSKWPDAGSPLVHLGASCRNGAHCYRWCILFGAPCAAY